MSNKFVTEGELSGKKNERKKEGKKERLLIKYAAVLIRNIRRVVEWLKTLYSSAEGRGFESPFLLFRIREG